MAQRLLLEGEVLNQEVHFVQQHRPALKRALRHPWTRVLVTGCALACGLLVTGSVFAADAAAARMSLELDSSDGGYVNAIKIAILIATLTFAPSILLAATSFTRIIIVLSLLRQAVGIVQLPPTRVLIGIALFLTMFTMAPVFSQINETALKPYEAGEMDEMAALKAAAGPLRTFMLSQTREDDLALFLRVSGASKPRNASDLSMTTVIPSFMLSELKTAFQMGALLFLPFLVIDMVVASILMSMGMMMLPPMTISLPLKLMVFVLVDGWGLVIMSLAQSVSA